MARLPNDDSAPNLVSSASTTTPDAISPPWWPPAPSATTKQLMASCSAMPIWSWLDERMPIALIEAKASRMALFGGDMGTGAWRLAADGAGVGTGFGMHACDLGLVPGQERGVEHGRRLVVDFARQFGMPPG